MLFEADETNHSKLKFISSVIGIVTSITAGWMFIETRYVHAKDIDTKMESIVVNSQQLMTDYRLSDYIAEYRWIQSRQDAGIELNTFEKSRQSYLLDSILRLQTRSIELQEKELKLESGEKIIKEVIIKLPSSNTE